ncbi:Bromodomain and WD repeat-containing protein 3 [Quaeritorhiza haematococci]|nr:Bromodomain and WD repeat-containing protein 3 [Quaeritorhiza haematococci]
MLPNALAALTVPENAEAAEINVASHPKLLARLDGDDGPWKITDVYFNRRGDRIASASKGGSIRIWKFDTENKQWTSCVIRVREWIEKMEPPPPPPLPPAPPPATHALGIPQQPSLITPMDTIGGQPVPDATQSTSAGGLSQTSSGGGIGSSAMITDSVVSTPANDSMPDIVMETAALVPVQPAGGQAAAPPPPAPAPQPPKPKLLEISTFVWSVDDSMIITATTDFVLRVWDSRTGQWLGSLVGHTNEIFTLDVHPIDPRIIMSAAYDGKIIVWNLCEKRQMCTFEITVPVLAGKFSPDGTQIALSDVNGMTHLYGLGHDLKEYTHTPLEQFFASDFVNVRQDQDGNLVDEQCQAPAHLVRNGPVVDSTFSAYPAYQAVMHRLKGSFVVHDEGIKAAIDETLQLLDEEQLSLIIEQIHSQPTPLDKKQLYKRRKLKKFAQSDDEQEINDILFGDVAPIVALPESSGDEYASDNDGENDDDDDEDDIDDRASDLVPERPKRELDDVRDFLVYDDEDYSEDSDGKQRKVKRKPMTRKRQASSSASTPKKKKDGQKGKQGKKKKGRVKKEGDVEEGRHLRRRKPVQYDAGGGSGSEFEMSMSGSSDDDSGGAVSDGVGRATPNSKGKGKGKKPETKRGPKKKGKNSVQLVPVQTTLEWLEANEWTTRESPRISPYLPQLGDMVALIRAGHEEFRWLLKESHGHIPQFQQYLRPFEYGSDDPVFFGRVVEIEYRNWCTTADFESNTQAKPFCTISMKRFLPQSSPSTLAPPLEDLAPSPDNKVYKVTFRDQEQLSDFVLLYEHYSRGMAYGEHLQRGETVYALYADDEWWEAQIEDIDETGTPWKKFLVTWPDSNQSPERFSPWELSRIRDVKFPCQQMSVEENQQVSQILEEATGWEEMELFLGSVPYHAVKDYLFFVPYPMCISVVQERLANNMYRRHEAVVWDVFMIFKNAVTYNLEDSEIYESAFEALPRLLSQICPKLDEAKLRAHAGNPVLKWRHISETHEDSTASEDTDAFTASPFSARITNGGSSRKAATKGSDSDAYSDNHSMEDVIPKSKGKRKAVVLSSSDEAEDAGASGPTIPQQAAVQKRGNGRGRPQRKRRKEDEDDEYEADSGDKDDDDDDEEEEEEEEEFVGGRRVNRKPATLSAACRLPPLRVSSVLPPTPVPLTPGPKGQTNMATTSAAHPPISPNTTLGPPQSYYESFRQTQHGELKTTFYNPFEVKHRRKTSKTQFKVLEEAFNNNPKPTGATRRQIASQINMTPREVQIWFQNRRAKAAKQKQQQENAGGSSSSGEGGSESSSGQSTTIQNEGSSAEDRTANETTAQQPSIVPSPPTPSTPTISAIAGFSGQVASPALPNDEPKPKTRKRGGSFTARYPGESLLFSPEDAVGISSNASRSGVSGNTKKSYSPYPQPNVDSLSKQSPNGGLQVDSEGGAGAIRGRNRAKSMPNIFHGLLSPGATPNTHLAQNNTEPSSQQQHSFSAFSQAALESVSSVPHLLTPVGTDGLTSSMPPKLKIDLPHRIDVPTMFQHTLHTSLDLDSGTHSPLSAIPPHMQPGLPTVSDLQSNMNLISPLASPVRMSLDNPTQDALSKSSVNPHTPQLSISIPRTPATVIPYGETSARTPTATTPVGILSPASPSVADLPVDGFSAAAGRRGSCPPEFISSFLGLQLPNEDVALSAAADSLRSPSSLAPIMEDVAFDSPSINDVLQALSNTPVGPMSPAVPDASNSLNQQSTQLSLANLLVPGSIPSGDSMLLEYQRMRGGRRFSEPVNMRRAFSTSAVPVSSALSQQHALALNINSIHNIQPTLGSPVAAVAPNTSFGMGMPLNSTFQPTPNLNAILSPSVSESNPFCGFDKPAGASAILLTTPNGTCASTGDLSSSSQGVSVANYINTTNIFAPPRVPIPPPAHNLSIDMSMLMFPSDGPVSGF